GSHAAFGELVEQARRLDPEDLALLRGELRAGPGLHDHHVVGVADEEAVHVHRDAIAIVGRLLLLPERLRDDAEHRAAVGLGHAVAEDLHVETADAHEPSVWGAMEIREFRVGAAVRRRALWARGRIDL